MSGDEASDLSHWHDVTAGAADPAPVDDARAGEAAAVRQEVAAQRDALTAGRDMHVYLAPAGVPASPSARPVSVWGTVPARNPKFTGREALLLEVHDRLHAGLPRRGSHRRQDPPRGRQPGRGASDSGHGRHRQDAALH
jgi:hypothetical protein